MKIGNTRIVDWMAFGCLHFPIHDEDGIKWLLAKIKERKPKVIVGLGDFIDADALSAFAKASRGALDKEYARVNEFCGEINEIAPNAKKVWIMGNHEQRMFREEYKPLAGVLDYRKQISEARHWRHIEYGFGPDYVFPLGQLTFFHGSFTSQAACKSEAIMLGVPFGLTVSAHTHRPHDKHHIRIGKTPLPYWHANTGTMIKPKPEYMLTKDDSLWGAAMVSGWANTKRRFDGNQNWDAKLDLYRMHWPGMEVAA